MQKFGHAGYSNILPQLQASQSAEEECCPVLLVSLGNPLLDMTAVVADTSLHQRYGLPTDGQLEVNKQQQSLFKLVAQQ